MKTHPFPLPATALEEFCHPEPDHLMAAPVRDGRDIVAANGYLALRAYKGAWLDSDYPEAGPELLARLNKLPWSKLQDAIAKPYAWTDLDRHRSTIMRQGRIGMWLRGRLNASPVWRITDHLVRLTFIQAIAALPRCEVYIGRTDRGDPLLFRFSGGTGMIATDPRLTLASHDLIRHRTDLFTGQILYPEPPIKAAAPARPPQWGHANWPPIDLSEL